MKEHAFNLITSTPIRLSKMLSNQHITKIFIILIYLNLVSKYECIIENKNNPIMTISNINNNISIIQIDSNSEQSFIIKNSSKCTTKICDSLGGQCIEEETCKCNEGFTTLLRNNNMKLCNYEKKSSIMAAFIELFLGFGLGHIYSGRKIYGIFKLLLSSLMCFVGCCAIAMGVKLESGERSFDHNTVIEFMYFIYGCVFNILVLWQILDFVLFIFKIYVDGNEIPLY